MWTSAVWQSDFVRTSSDALTQAVAAPDCRAVTQRKAVADESTARL